MSGHPTRQPSSDSSHKWSRWQIPAISEQRKIRPEHWIRSGAPQDLAQRRIMTSSGSSTSRRKIACSRPQSGQVSNGELKRANEHKTACGVLKSGCGTSRTRSAVLRRATHEPCLHVHLPCGIQTGWRSLTNSLHASLRPGRRSRRLASGRLTSCAS